MDDERMNIRQAERYLLEKASAAGIELEAFAAADRVLTLEAFGARLSEVTQAQRGGIGLRVVDGGRVGYASTEEITRSALDWAFQEAVENAGLSDDTDGFIPQGEALGQRDLLSEGLSATMEEKSGRALALEQALRDDERTKQVFLARYSERERSASLASTRGAEGRYRNGTARVEASYIMGRGDGVKQGSDVDVAKDLHALDPLRTSQRMLERTGRLLGARPLPTGRRRAYLEPKVVAELLSLVLYNLNGRNLIEGTSRFADRLGARVASELVTLADDPTLDQGLASRPFDAEGTPARRTPLLDKGVLRSFLHNSATSRTAGHPNTGHAYRSYQGPLDVAASNLLLDPGAGIAVTDGVVVTEVMGVHAGANPISGDLSLQGLGLWIEGGEVAYPVDNFALSGNLFRMLEAVVGVGSKTEWLPAKGAMMRVPMLEIESLSFAGA